MDFTHAFSITSPDPYPLQHATSQTSLCFFDVQKGLTPYELTRTK